MVGKTKKKLKIMTSESLSLNSWKKLAEDKIPYRKILFTFKQENEIDEFSTILNALEFCITETLQCMYAPGLSPGQSVSDKPDVKDIKYSLL